MMTGIYAHDVFQVLSELVNHMATIEHASVVVSYSVGFWKVADEA